MSIIYVPHTVTTIAEVNALALSDLQETGAIVLFRGEAMHWDLPHAVRNEQSGRWVNYGCDEALFDGDEATVLVPVEVTVLEDYHRDLDADRTTYRTPWRAR